MTSRAWALEVPLNPSVLRLHVRTALTHHTIVTCPPAPAPAPFDALVRQVDVRSVDLHRYRARINLGPHAHRDAVHARSAALLSQVWGPPSELASAALPRAFAFSWEGPRSVAESAEMAKASAVPVLIALFGVDGVEEAIAGQGVLLVRIGRLFSWTDVEPRVRAAIAQ
jgi:hypothetical protein